ncbi:ankyrin repeat domain-containing protein 27-like isoform X2 [Babylonia areolata]|uniref:ankyrin repeat domain-containing protein 27-like isoform X2 n=1 Tax=Babylonia areolata TaxID=304850 RepID=UPI003FD60367
MWTNLTSTPSSVRFRAQERCYTICIPQSSSIQASAINKDFAETHILRPSPYFKGELLTIHGNSSRTVSLDEDAHTITTVEGFPSKVIARITSEELAYNKEYKQYRILILNQPLDPQFQRNSAEDNTAIGQKRCSQCVTLAECRQFLHSIPSFSKVAQKVDGAVRLFNSNYMVLPNYLKDAASRLAIISAQGVEVCRKCVETKRAVDSLWNDTLAIAMESYVMSQVHCKVMGVVQQHWSAADSRLQDKCRQQLGAIRGEALGIQPRFICPLPEAVQELKRLSQLTTPREKLHCLKAVIDAVTSSIAAHLSRDVPPHLALVAEKPSLTSDDLIPILVSLMGQTACQHMQSELVYMETFTWASTAKDMDDLSYCLVTFKAAAQYILDTDFSPLLHKNSAGKQASSVNKITLAADRLSLSNGGSGGSGGGWREKSPSPRHSPTPLTPTTGGAATAPAVNRLERQLSRVTKALEDVPKVQARAEKEKTVTSIFGAHYEVPVALELGSETQATPQLGDFLSSLQDDFMDQPFGKQA